MATSRQIEKVLRVWTGRTRAAISIMISPNEDILNICIINADGTMSFAQASSLEELVDQIRSSEDAEDVRQKIVDKVVMN
jgi:hypothetical protein